MGLHTGPAEPEGDEYAPCHTLNRVARVEAAAHGGQILLSQEAADLVSREMPSGVTLQDRGEHRLKGMAVPEHLYQVVAPDLPHDFPPISSAKPVHNLPVSLTPFVGREAEMAAIGERLQDPEGRLLTLVGPGGIGKTRLAVEVASAQVESYADGVFFVSLAPLRSPDAIVPTVARALEFSLRKGEDPRQQLLDYLGQKNMLLVLDNFEHLLACPERGRGDGVDLVTDTLKTAPGVRIVVTSRERLNVQGEHLRPVPGMDYPEEVAPTAEESMVSSAVRLFLHSARRVRPDFQPTHEDLAEVGQICRLVAGMPLAILLAAAWAEMLTPQEIAAEIKRGIDVLETDLRDAPERHRSMRAVFDNSWNLLTARPRGVMEALSVFRGGFTREAAQTISNATSRDLMALIHKSLLQRAPGGRYELHELLGQYAAERLEASERADAVRDAHSAYYCAAMERWAADLQGPRQWTAFVESATEAENARTAWDWALQQVQLRQLDRAMDALGLVHHLAEEREEGETLFRLAAETLETALGKSEETHGHGLRVLSRMLTWQGLFLNELRGPSDLPLRKSLALLDSPQLTDFDTRREKAFALSELGKKASHNLRREKARCLYRQSLSLYRAVGDRWAMGRLMAGWGDLEMREGIAEKAREWFAKSINIGRSIGDWYHVTKSLSQLARLALQEGQLEEAERLAREANALAQEHWRGSWEADPDFLGFILVRCGKLGEARSQYEESRARGQERGSEWVVARANVWLGFIEAHLGQYEDARALARAALAVFKQSPSPIATNFPLEVLGLIAVAEGAHAEARQLLGETVALLRGLRFGRGALSLALSLLALAADGLGRPDEARGLLREAVRLATEDHAFFALLYAVPATALILARQGEAERAVELFALASHHPFVASASWFEDVAGKHIVAAAESLLPDAVAAAQERGRARDLWETARALLDELEEEQEADAP